MFFDEKLTELAAIIRMSKMIAQTAGTDRRMISVNSPINPTVSSVVWMMPNWTIEETQKFSIP